MLNYKSLCVAFAALALSACSGEGPTAPTGPYMPPVPDPLPTTVTVLSIESNGLAPVPGAKVTLPDGRTLMTDGAGIANPGAPLLTVGTVFRIEKDPVNQVGGFLGPRIVRFGLDDEPAGSGRYTIQPLRSEYTADFVLQLNGYTLGKAPGPLTFRNRDNDPRIDITLFEQGYRDWVAAGCDTNGGAPAVVEVWIDPNDPDIIAEYAAAITKGSTTPGVWTATVFYSEKWAHSSGVIRHELGWSIGLHSPTVGWSIMSNTSGHVASDITEFDAMNCRYRAHRKEGNRWVDDATQVR